jgi:hypothetical protein
VPESSIDIYKSVAPWNKFFAIVPIEGTGIKTNSIDVSNSQMFTPLTAGNWNNLGKELTSSGVPIKL